MRGPNVSRGYLNRPEETAAAFRNGWYHTGDVGRVDERGRLHILDRKKDMVITGGENVYTSEAEIALSKHPKVLECAVTGVPDNTYGEALLAAIVAVPGATVTAAELIGFCRDYIGGYKIPRRYVFLDSLPRSTLHKVLKHELRRRYGDNDGDAAPGTCAGKRIGSGQSVAAAARSGKTPGMAAQDKRGPTIKAARKAFP